MGFTQKPGQKRCADCGRYWPNTTKSCAWCDKPLGKGGDS